MHVRLLHAEIYMLKCVGNVHILFQHKPADSLLFVAMLAELKMELN